MPPQNNFLQTVLGFAQLKAQQDEAAQRVAEQDSARKQAAWSIILNVAKRSADPSQLTALANHFAPMVGDTPENLLKTMAQVTPESDVMQSRVAKAGVEDLEGVPLTGGFTNTPGFARTAIAAASHLLAGSNPGDIAASDFRRDMYDTTPAMSPKDKSALGHMMQARELANTNQTGIASDTATSTLPASVFQKGLKYNTGVEVSPLDAIKVGLESRGITLDEWYKPKMVGVEETRNLIEGGRGVNAGKLEPKNLPELYTAHNKMYELLRGGTLKSKSEIVDMLNSMRAIRMAINSASGTNNMPDISPEEFAQEMNQPGVGAVIKEYFGKKPGSPLR